MPSMQQVSGYDTNSSPGVALGGNCVPDSLPYCRWNKQFLFSSLGDTAGYVVLMQTDVKQ